MKKVGKILIWLLVLVCVFAFTGFVVNSHFYNKHYKNATVEQKTKRSFYNIKNILTSNTELLSQMNVVVNKNKGDRDDTITISEANKLWDDNYYMYIKIPYNALDNRFHQEIHDFFSGYRHSCGAGFQCYIQIEYVKGRCIKSSVARDFTATGFSDEDILFTRHNIYDANGEEIYNTNNDVTMEVIKKGQNVILNLLPTFKKVVFKSKPAMW